MTTPGRKLPGSGVGLPGDLADCMLIRMRVAVHQIDLVCRLMEGHEDLALIRTENGNPDILEVWVPRGMLPDVEALLGTLVADGTAVILSGPEIMPANWLGGREW